MKKGEKMPRVMIKCSKTGKPVDTGMVFDKASFESSNLINNTIGRCPHCGENHTWNKEDAYLEIV